MFEISDVSCLRFICFFGEKLEFFFFLDNWFFNDVDKVDGRELYILESILRWWIRGLMDWWI